MSDRNAARRWLGPGPAPEEPTATAPLRRIGNTAEQSELLEMLGLPGETSGPQLSELLKTLRALPDAERAAALEACGIIERIGPTRLSRDSVKALLLRLVTSTNINLLIRQLGNAR